MSPDTTILPLIQEVMGSLAPHYQTAVRATFADYEFQGADWFVSYVTYGIGEKGLTSDKFHTIFPYVNEIRQQAMFTQATEHGFLQTEDDKTYTLTEIGNKGVQSFFTNARVALDAISPLPEANLTRLAELLKQVVFATKQASEPAEKFNLKLSRSTAPDDNATAVSHIDQYITDLNVYRDDAHLAAWRSLGITGQNWEAFTFVWRGDANTGATLAERLPNRGYDEASYEAALQTLVSHGWLIEKEGVYKITQAGQKLRDEAEKATERNFVVGWSALSQDETVELKNLLSQFRDGLRQLTADKATAVFSDLGDVTGRISRAMFTLTRPGVDPVIEAANLEKPGLAYMLIMASVFDQPVTAELLGKRSPYSALSRYNKTFAALVDEGMMTGDENGYLLTENGRSLVNAVLNGFHKQLATLQPTLTTDLTEVELNRLAELLEQLSQACLNAGDPPGTWCIEHIQGLPLPDKPSALSRIDKVLDDLNAFRDDAHIAAFKPYKIEGHVWELFTALWRKDVANPAEMADKYEGRGHAEADYQQALLDLVRRGWVEEAEQGEYVVTENGRSLREEAETRTDTYYYLPWGGLLPDTEELHTLLNKADAALQKAVEANAETIPA